MPRLPKQLLAAAWRENPHLPLLLRTCRDLRSARLELKWLEEHARNVAHRSQLPSWRLLMKQFCHDRSRGRPLQYILGTEFFGELELKCRKGVLIPRQETAAYVLHLVDTLRSNTSRLPSHLRVLDLCTGSGCIALLFAHSFSIQTQRNTSLDLLGVDISPKSIALAQENRSEQATLYPSSAIKDVRFLRANLLEKQDISRVPALLDMLRNTQQTQWDIIISNPPYISPKHFNHTTTRSVRNFEPKVALVPFPTNQRLSDDQHGDLFYPRLLGIAQQLHTKILLLEVGDLDQARRVTALAKACGRWTSIEIWRGNPSADSDGESDPEGIPIRGQGHGRSVLLWRCEGASWLGR